jgi:hypothetical protein
MNPPRRFIRPWRVIERDESFEVQDAVGTHLYLIQIIA